MSMEIRPRDHHTGRVWGVKAALLVAFLPVWGQGRAQLRGMIEDPTEARVANVTVSLISVEHGFQTVSGPDGTFRFDDIAPDEYELEIAAAGFAKQKLVTDLRSNPVPAPLDIILKISDLLACGPDPAVSYKSLDAARLHVVGLVQDYDHDKAVSRAHIALKPSGAREWAYEARSDKKGEFRFGEIAVGLYDVRISGDGYEVVELKRVMAPRASALYIKAVLLRRGELLACQ